MLDGKSRSRLRIAVDGSPYFEIRGAPKRVSVAGNGFEVEFACSGRGFSGEIELSCYVRRGGESRRNLESHNDKTGDNPDGIEKKMQCECGIGTAGAVEGFHGRVAWFDSVGSTISWMRG